MEQNKCRLARQLIHFLLSIVVVIALVCFYVVGHTFFVSFCIIFVTYVECRELRWSLALLSPGAEVSESPRRLLLALLSPGAELQSYQCEEKERNQRYH